jgi:hypothetical protein
MGKQPDLVNHPPHYTNGISDFGRRVLVECFDVNADKLHGQPKDFMKHHSPFPYLPLHLGQAAGSIIKYVWRCEHKEQYLRDLRKARFYINLFLEEIVEPPYRSQFFYLESKFNRANVMVQAEIDRLVAEGAFVPMSAGCSEGLGCK